MILALLSIYLTSFGIIYITGTVVTGSFLRGEARYWSLVPIIGLTFLISLFAALLALGFSLRAILLLHLLFVAAACVFSFRNLPPLVRRQGFHFLGLTTGSIFAYIFLCYPLLIAGAPYPPVFGSDAAFYCAITDFIMNRTMPAPYPESIGNPLEIQQFGLNTRFRLGFNILHALVSAILQKRSFLTFYPIMAFCWSLFIFPAFYFFQQTRPQSSPRRHFLASACFAALFFFHVAVFGQMALGAASSGMGLVFLFTAFFILPESLHPNRFSLKTFFLTGLLLTALMSAYPVVLVYFLFSLVILLLFNLKSYKRILFVICSLAINPVALVWFSPWLYRVLGFVLERRGGELWDFPAPDEWLGFYLYTVGSVLPTLMRWCGAGIAFILAGKFVLSSASHIRSLLVALLLPFVISFVFTRWFLIFPYASYKNMVFFVPLAMLLISGGIVEDA